MLTVQRCQAGGQGQVLASTLPRAQYRTAKGSIILRRRATLSIWVYYLSMIVQYVSGVTCWSWMSSSRFSSFSLSSVFSSCPMNFTCSMVYNVHAIGCATQMVDAFCCGYGGTGSNPNMLQISSQ